MPGPLRSLPPPNKKRKTEQDASTVQSIQALESDLTKAISTNASLNPLADLLDIALATDIAVVTSKAIYALYRVFVLIIAGGKMSLSGDEAQKVVKAWLWDRFNVYVDYLGSLLKDEENSLRISALQILFSLQKHLSTSYTRVTPSRPQFHISHMRKIMSALVLCPPSMRLQKSRVTGDANIELDVLHQLHQTWFSIYDDVRWFFFREAATLLQTTEQRTAPQVATNLLSILEGLKTFPTDKTGLKSWWVSEMGIKPPKSEKYTKDDKFGEEDDEENDVEDEDDWRKFFDEDPVAKESKPQGPSARLHKLTIHQSLHSLRSHRAMFTRAWMALLPRLSLADGHEKALTLRGLNIMHRGVLPHLTRPILVMDWVGAAVDHGGVVGLLALNALFVLMKEYNLDYPRFYTRLYGFLDRDLLHLKHRARFFRMTELFLSSTHLPANLLASFIKRLSRLSLTAPPAAIIMVVPFTYNITKRHPALMAMLHRSDVQDPSDDPYLPEETDPLNTQALLSSLWELLSHRSHYHSGVSTLVKIFSEAFTKPNYNIEDFLDHTYATLFDTDANRKIKREPALAIDIGKNLDLFRTQAPSVVSKFDDKEIDNAGADDDIINGLWRFETS